MTSAQEIAETAHGHHVLGKRELDRSLLLEPKLGALLRLATTGQSPRGLAHRGHDLAHSGREERMPLPGCGPTLPGSRSHATARIETHTC